MAVGCDDTTNGGGTPNGVEHDHVGILLQRDSIKRSHAYITATSVKQCPVPLISL